MTRAATAALTWNGLAACAAAPLLPWLYVQGARVRRDTPRLPEASGPCVGLAVPPGGDGPPLRLLLLGESTVAGVGAANHDEALAGRFAATLAARLGRPVAWRAAGGNGCTVREATERILPALAPEPQDLAVLVFGVNDSTAFHSIRNWRADLTAAVARVQAAHGGCPVMLAGVPPLHRFPALPQPLRGVLGLKSRALDAAARALVRTRADLCHVPMPRLDGSDMFAVDGFHPGPAGYALWGAHLAEAAARWVTIPG